MRTLDLATTEIIDQIYDASTLEDAIFWREEFVRRLAGMIANSNLLDPEWSDEIALYAATKAQCEQAIARLQMAVDKNERFDWRADRAAR